ncbi:nucleotidyltransferase, partial [Vibrio parahaemolyticus]|nr:nucleotidyltransferase [Vibrio parahaemolyticus]
MAVKSFALIDGTGFYAHSSAQFHPGLKGKPVLVSAGQGISIAGANIKEFGIPKFSPIWEIDSKVAMHHGAIFKCNFNTLGQISRNFKQSRIDVSEGLPIFHYSVDESWVETTELLKNGIDLESEAWRWREHIWKTTGVPTGVGIGPSLTLSKLASFAAKKL